MLIKTVTETINHYNMINKGDRIIVALSGGADSVCLLCILSSLKTELDFSLEAVHINHCIRGAESDEDEEFCNSLCQKLGIPFKVYRLDIPALAKTSGKSLEETARDARYEKFSEYAAENGVIATAHTLSDNAETVIFNMVRGTGIKGLCGIPPVRDNIIRPLSSVTREQVEEFLCNIQQDFRTDSTNLSDDYTRNKIRHKIIPVMHDINNGFFKSFANTLNVLREENEFVQQLSEKAYSDHSQNNRLVNLQEIPPVIRKRVISSFLSRNNLPVSYDKINEVYMLTEKNGRLNISKDCFIIGKNGCISVEKQSYNNTVTSKEIPLENGINRIFENKTLTVSEDKNNKYLIDMNKVCGKLILHSRRNGDKIKLSGKDFTSSVKKLLNEKVPPKQRPFIHFISDENGLIFMEGFGVADRVKTDENTCRFFSVCVEETEGA